MSDNLAEENLKLRQLLAFEVSNVNLYCDDGELQDSSCYPVIDFRRDSPEEIEAKIRRRTELFGAALDEGDDSRFPERDQLEIIRIRRQLKERKTLDNPPPRG